MVDVRLLIGLIGATVTLALFVLGISFRMGHVTARVEELEKWRSGIRMDMHEISDKLEKLFNEMASIKTLIDERTERREVKRMT